MKTIPAKKSAVEMLYDDKGNLLYCKPYPFSKLFAKGQGQIINSVSMTVLSCKKEGNIVTTHVKLHSPWRARP